MASANGCHLDAEFIHRQLAERTPDRVCAVDEQDRMQARLVAVESVVVGVAFAAEEAAQRPVADQSRLAETFEDVRGGDAGVTQRVRGEHHARFECFRDDLGSPRALQSVEVLFVERAHDHGQVRFELADVFEDALGGARIGKGDHQHAGASDAGGNERFAACGVAIHHVLAGRRRFADTFGIQIQGHVGDGFLLHEAGQVLAATAVTADDDVLLGVHRLRRQAGELHRAHQPLAGREAQDDAVAVLHDHRCQQHREDQRRENGLQGQRRHKVQSAHFGQQNETEFATGAEPESGARGVAGA